LGVVSLYAQTDFIMPSLALQSLSFNGTSGFSNRLQYLHHLLTDEHGGYENHIQAYLQAGCRMLSADGAALLKVRLLRNQAQVTHAEGGMIAVDSSIDLREAWIAEVITEKNGLSVADSSVNTHAVPYNNVSLGAYISTPLKASGHTRGVLSFFFKRQQSEGFSQLDHETVEMMAKGVAKMMEAHKLQQQVDSLGGALAESFATPGVKTFPEYVEMARIPETYGVPGRVIGVLQNRIGRESLSIDRIADDLNLSKRTLQRRLQQHDISFAQLRDNVRFHHSIAHLIEHHESIDSISSSLDFSDRTSFTNAFKRWTNLSPSAFRKLFRDYA